MTLSRMCSAHVMRGRQPGLCGNRAWWPGGRCHRHIEPLPIGDWLDGFVRGTEASMLPKYATITAMVRMVDGNGIGYRWYADLPAHANGASRSQVRGDGFWPSAAHLVVLAGSHAVFHVPNGKRPFIMAASVSDALVATDKMLTRRDSAVVRRLAEHVAAQAQRASVIDEAVASEISAEMVVSQRKKLGTWQALPSTADLRWTLAAVHRLDADVRRLGKRRTEAA